MQAWHCDESRPIPALVRGDFEPPPPGPGELLIRVQAAGITPTELQWYPTTHTKMGTNRRHAIPGHEFSGTIVGAGTGAEALLGEDVFGMNDWFAEGATAEFYLALSSSVALKPARLTHADAASVPIGALTAWQGLLDRARLQAGERILIHGGAGAVGVYAVQLAHWLKARVITTASERHREFLLQLGADRVIDYHTERFEDAASGVDIIFDTVGGTTLERSWNVLGPRGRLVTIAASGETTTDESIRQAFFIVEPRGDQLSEIADLLDTGRLRPLVRATVPFERAGAIYADPSQTPRAPGKVVTLISHSAQP